MSDEITRRVLRIDAGDAAPAGVRDVAVEIIAPRRPRHDRVWWMLPGGSMSRRYWDLRTPGHSCAAVLARDGYVCVAVDHAGVGDSDVPDDPYLLTPAVLAAINVHVHARVLEILRRGDADLPPLAAASTIGCGHSMGGMITALTQATYRPHSALCLLGYSGRGLPERLEPSQAAYAGRPDALRADICELVRAKFGEPLPLRPFVAAEVLREAQARLLTVAGLSAMMPGAFDDELAAIDVPVMLGRGEHDICSPLDETAAAFTAAPEIHTVEIAAMGHNHNASSRRELMWAAMAEWADGLSAR